jgi:hypothetical protein
MNAFSMKVRSCCVLAATMAGACFAGYEMADHAVPAIAKGIDTIVEAARQRIACDQVTYERLYNANGTLNKVLVRIESIEACPKRVDK